MESFLTLPKLDLIESLQEETAQTNSENIWEWIDNELQQKSQENQIENPIKMDITKSKHIARKSAIFIPQQSLIESVSDEGLQIIIEENQGSQQESKQYTLKNIQISQVQQEEKPHKPPKLNMKRSVKRAQTAAFKDRGQNLNQTQQIQPEDWQKKSKKNIKKTFDKIQKLKSGFTDKFGLNQFKQGIIQVKIFFFNKHQHKHYMVDEKMPVIEFINKIIQDYMKDNNFDHKLLEYPNYSLAYKLDPIEEMEQDEQQFAFRRPIKKSKSFISPESSFVESRIKSRNRSMKEDYPIYGQKLEQLYEDDHINIDLGAPITFKSAQLDPVQEQGKQIYEVGLAMAKKAYEISPEEIIILIEDPEIKKFTHEKVNKEHNVEVLIDKFLAGPRTHYNRVEYALFLKYPCLNFGADPINEKMPIKNLPIHWLTIQKKPQQFLILKENTADLNNVREREMSGIKSQRILNDDFQQQDTHLKYPTLFAYQEFELMKKDGKIKNLVTIGIDFFDFYYTYKNDRVRGFSLIRSIKNFAKYLLEERTPYQKNYKRIPLQTIISVNFYQPGEAYAIKYQKTQTCEKILFFCMEKQQEKSTKLKAQQALNESYSKLEFLIEQRSKYQSLDKY